MNIVFVLHLPTCGSAANCVIFYENRTSDGRGCLNVAQRRESRTARPGIGVGNGFAFGHTYGRRPQIKIVLLGK